MNDRTNETSQTPIVQKPDLTKINNPQTTNNNQNTIGKVNTVTERVLKIIKKHWRDWAPTDQLAPTDSLDPFEMMEDIVPEHPSNATKLIKETGSVKAKIKSGYITLMPLNQTINTFNNPKKLLTVINKKDIPTIKGELQIKTDSNLDLKNSIDLYKKELENRANEPEKKLV